MDTFTTLWSRVQLRVPAAAPELCQDLIRDAFQQLVERRMWSWLIGSGAFMPPVIAAPGTVTIAAGGAVVTGIGTAFSAALVGKQIVIGGASYFPTYTVVQVGSAASLVLDRPWVGPDQANVTYTLYQCYFAMPDDFQHFYSVTSPANNYRLNHNATQAEIDSYDPQRSQSGDSYALAFLDYTRNTQGRVGDTIRAKGVGAAPVFTTANGYSYPQDSVYVVEISTSGASGTATFRWEQTPGIAQGTGLLTSASPVDLASGVQVYFPVGGYVAGDVFVTVAKTDATSGVPRYELWPRPVGVNRVYSYLYAKKLPALTDEDPALPPFIARRGDVLVEMALAPLALWPGTANQPNSYRDPQVAQMHAAKAERLIYELEKKDDDTAIRDLAYAELPYMGPWRDGSWLQSHAVYPYV